MYICSIICLRLFISLVVSFTFLDFLVFKHAECRLKRFKRPAALKKIDYSMVIWTRKPAVNLSHVKQQVVNRSWHVCVGACSGNGL